MKRKEKIVRYFLEFRERKLSRNFIGKMRYNGYNKILYDISTQNIINTSGIQYREDEKSLIEKLEYFGEKLFPEQEEEKGKKAKSEETRFESFQRHAMDYVSLNDEIVRQVEKRMPKDLSLVNGFDKLDEILIDVIKKIFPDKEDYFAHKRNGIYVLECIKNPRRIISKIEDFGLEEYFKMDSIDSKSQEFLENIWRMDVEKIYGQT